MALAQVRVGLADVLKRADLRLRLSCPPVRDGPIAIWPDNTRESPETPG